MSRKRITHKRQRKAEDSKELKQWSENLAQGEKKDTGYDGDLGEQNKKFRKNWPTEQKLAKRLLKIAKQLVEE